MENAVLVGRLDAKTTSPDFGHFALRIGREECLAIRLGLELRWVGFACRVEAESQRAFIQFVNAEHGLALMLSLRAYEGNRFRHLGFVNFVRSFIDLIAVRQGVFPLGKDKMH